jgi:NADH-quinone oxidoreductase subunit E
MQQIQAHCGGWLPDEAIRETSEITGVSIPEVEGVATFFNWFFREPVGREIVTVCDSLPCWIGGCEKLRDSCERVLGITMGQTTSDGAFTLLPIVCLGNCDNAPTMMVGEEIYDRVTPESLPLIFDKHRSHPTRMPIAEPHAGAHH